VREQLVGPLVAQFATAYRNHAIRLVADDDTVAVECRGDGMTKTGRPCPASSATPRVAECFARSASTGST
jgi:hypothetical protein